MRTPKEKHPLLGEPMNVMENGIMGAGVGVEKGDPLFPCVPEPWRTATGGRSINTLLKCTARSSRTGKPCRNPRMSRYGLQVCWTHGGAGVVARRVRGDARRATDAFDAAIDELVRNCLEPDPIRY